MIIVASVSCIYGLGEPEEYEKFVTFIRLKGERYLEAKAHPGQGRAERHTPGERELEGR